MATRATGNSFGNLIRKRRKQLDMTQADVARKVGCRPNYIGYLEAGARRPSQSLLLRLAKALDLDAQELFLLAYPQVRQAVGRARPDEERLSAWEKFKNNKVLHARHGISRSELATLERIAAMGRIRSERDFLFILQTIRQALAED